MPDKPDEIEELVESLRLIKMPPESEEECEWAQERIIEAAGVIEDLRNELEEIEAKTSS